MSKTVISLLKLQFRLEWQERKSYLAILIYLLSTSYVAFLVLSDVINSETWNAFFWVLFLFAAIQAAFRSFSYEGDRRFLLYFGLVRPESLMISKIAYNFVYLLVISFISLAVLQFFLGSTIESVGAFAFILVLASFGFSAILTFVAGLTAKANGNPALPTILSVPLLYPQVLSLSRLSSRAMTGFDWQVNSNLLIVMALLSLVGILLAYLLFPYLWRD